MANPLKGEAVLVLEDGRKFTLTMDFEALVLAERAYDKPVEKMLADAIEGFSGALRALLWAALRLRHSQISMDDATDILTADRMAVIGALTAALNDSMPDKVEGDTSGNRKARRAGKSSGGNGAKRA